MQRRAEDANYITLVFLGDLALTLLAFFIAYRARVILPFGVRPLTSAEISTPPGLYLLVAIIWTGVFAGMKIYEPGNILDFSAGMKKLPPAIGLAAFVFAGALYLSYRDTPRLMFIYFVTLDFLLLVGFRKIIHALLQRTGTKLLPPLGVLIVGVGDLARSLAEKIENDPESRLRLVGLIAESEKQISSSPPIPYPILGQVQDIPRIVETHAIDYIVFALPLSRQQSIRQMVMSLYERPVRIFIAPDVLELAFFRVSVQEWHGIPLLGLKEPVITGFPRIVKRLFDLIIATAMLAILWPVMLLAAIAIKLDSPGPIILRQKRVGENGKLFTLYKFRSMVADAENLQHEISTTTPAGKRIHKRPHDPRVTRVGRYLRRTSIDELPQLFNVLKGDMSMVGPRPELPYIVDDYEPWQYKRFAVPPGITGWWQISGRSDKPMHMHTEDDLYYITHYSPWLDIQILFKTIWVVIKGEGAY